MTDSVQYHHLFEEDRVHRRVYTDPDVFAAEMDRIFSRTWVFVAHESEVPNIGDAKSDVLAGRPIIVVRGDDDQVRVLFNACRHRGAKVCHHDYTNVRNFRCLYHGWQYDTRGRLSFVPLRDKFQDLDMGEASGLIPLPRVETHRGFIFASLNPEVTPLLEHLGHGTRYLDLMADRAPDGKLEVSRPIKYDYPGNWKLQIENYADNYHPIFLHQTALEVGIKMMAEKYGASRSKLMNAAEHKERTYGAGHSVTDYGETRGALWIDAYKDPEYLAKLKAKYPEDQAQYLRNLDMHMIIYPNLLLHSRQSHYRVIKPTAVNRTEVWAYPCKLVGAPAEVNECLVLNTSHHTSAMGEVQVDDLQAFKWVQEGLKADAMEWILLKLHGNNEHVLDTGEVECFGPTESIVRHQYAEWRRLMDVTYA